MSPTVARLQLIQNEKFYSRVLSKETSASNPSFRVYYGVAAGSVPFLWESQPGTPKHAMADSSLPPLTPPPSYYFSSNKKANFIKSHKQSLFQAMLPRLRKPHAPPPPLASASSSSGSHRRARSSSSTISSFSSNSRVDEEEQEEGLSPTSTLCIGERRGCYSMIGMKKALLSIVGSGSCHRPAA
ncbi:uncharacterized protein LOC110023677 [Phalaenopsis equestris]|uniref:uncharacterized protein LOC110023677 n=1 Tax=Phalaenopsis equestris TaxID=78828 RepID=UPI0009E281B1|nr:uncharacterized protein LOC110023677 [Phalaenopsis equestris]